MGVNCVLENNFQFPVKSKEATGSFAFMLVTPLLQCTSVYALRRCTVVYI